jgi:GNAT superfamily N-acetyltransferase
MDRLEQIAETYTWYHGIGNLVERDALACYVRNVEHSYIWVANHVSCVRASSPPEIECVLKRADDALAHCTHRMFIIDPLTPDAFVARLALDGYTELTPTLQMVLDGSLVTSGSRGPGAGGSRADIKLSPVETDADWDDLYLMARANHIEGSSSHHLELDDDVTRRMVAGYRAKATVAQFFLARIEGVACAYGSAVIGPHGMGIVEDLFTLQAYRLRGIATEIIIHAVGYARARGMGPMLIGPHVSESPKTFYAALGFVPQCITRQYFRE